MVFLVFVMKTGITFMPLLPKTKMNVVRQSSSNRAVWHRAPFFFASKNGIRKDAAHWNSAATYSPGPFPAKYHRRYEA